MHSPEVPDTGEITDLLRAARRWTPAEQLWANPDCALKTRTEAKVTPALRNLVAPAKAVRP